MSRARENYREWSQKEVAWIERGHFVHWPEYMGVVGTAVNLLYKSDKWEKDGVYFPYTHGFDSRPSIFSVRSKRDLESVKQLLNVPTLHGAREWPHLAVCQKLLYECDGRQKSFQFSSDGPRISCSDDKRAVIICGSDILIIKGGKMRVTERGIEF